MEACDVVFELYWPFPALDWGVPQPERGRSIYQTLETSFSSLFRTFLFPPPLNVSLSQRLIGCLQTPPRSQTTSI